MANIVVIGSLNMDLVIETEKVPKIGETVLGKSLHNICGGKGGNQATAAAKQGADVSMIGCVGEDSYGDILRETLKQSGVNVDGVFREEHTSSGVAVITVENGDNSIIVISGANSCMDISYINRCKDILKNADIILLQLEIPIETVEYVVKYARSIGVKTILNPAPAYKLRDKVFENVDYFIPNETECEFYTGIKIETVQDAMQCIKTLNEKKILHPIITLGENGVVYGDGEEILHIPARKVDVVDTTAAGDSFIAAFAVAIVEGKTMTEAVCFASAVASITVTRMGAQTSIPTRNEAEIVFASWKK